MPDNVSCMPNNAAYCLCDLLALGLIGWEYPSFFLCLKIHSITVLHSAQIVIHTTMKFLFLFSDIPTVGCSNSLINHLQTRELTFVCNYFSYLVSILVSLFAQYFSHNHFFLKFYVLPLGFYHLAWTKPSLYIYFINTLPLSFIAT